MRLNRKLEFLIASLILLGTLGCSDIGSGPGLEKKVESAARTPSFDPSRSDLGEAIGGLGAISASERIDGLDETLHIFKADEDPRSVYAELKEILRDRAFERRGEIESARSIKSDWSKTSSEGVEEIVEIMILATRDKKSLDQRSSRIVARLAVRRAN